MSSNAKACFRCRQKKIRCDSSRPTCQQCLKANTPAECIYGEESELPGIRILEERISRLRGRIAFLESNTAGPVTLHDPYQSRQTQPEAPASIGRRTLSSATAQALMRSFSGGASQAGVFLHVPRFLQRTSSLPPSTTPRHTSTLMNAVYLLGAYFSPDRNLQDLQHDLLAYALEDLSSTLLDLSPSAILDILQTEVLLAHYFFSNNRTVEGVYHMDAASAVVLASRLHQIRSTRNQPPVGSVAARYQLAPAADSIEEGERINAFWSTFTLDQCWSRALGRSPILTDDESKGTEIDTPWPLNIEAYEHIPLPQGFRTVQTYLCASNQSSTEHGPLSSYAKASTLYNAATRVAAQFVANPNSIAPGWTKLSNDLAQLQQNLPSMDRISPVRLDLMTKLLLINLLVCAATVELHQPVETQGIQLVPNSRSLAAAHAAVDVLSRVNVGGVAHVDPIIGYLLASIAGMLIRGVRSLRQNSGPTGSAEENTLLLSLARIRFALETWCKRNEYIRSQLAVVLRAMEGI